MNNKEKIETACKKKEKGESLRRRCEYARASKRFQKALKFIENDISFSDEEKRHVKDLKVYIDLVIDSCNRALYENDERKYQIHEMLKKRASHFYSSMKEILKEGMERDEETEKERKRIQAVEMEKLTDYTCNSEYLQEYNNLMSHQEVFLKEVLNVNRASSTVKLEGVGDIDVVQLMKYPYMLNQAYDLKARLIAYWKIVLRRLIDVIALHLMLSINELVNVDLQKEICNELLSSSGGGVERLLEESPSISGKRQKLSRSVTVLKESKEAVANIMDRIGNYGDN